MSNRKGGRYDAGNWWAPPSPSPPRWGRVRSAIVTVILVAAVLVVIGAWGWYSITHRGGEEYRDSYDGPDRSGQFHNR